MSSIQGMNTRAKRISSKRDFPRLYVQAIFALAAALALTTSACGKKEDVATPVPTAVGVAPPTSTSSIGTIGNGDKTAGTGELDKQSGTPATVVEKRGEGKAKTSTDSLAPTGSAVIVPEPEGMETLFPSKTEAAVEKTSAPSEVDEADDKEVRVKSVVYFDHNGPTSDQISNRKRVIEKRGAYLGELVPSDIASGNGDDLYYTGAGTDDLRDLLWVKVNERLAKQHSKIRQGDIELAQTVQLADFDLNWETRRAVLNFKLERIGSKGKRVMSLVTMEGPLTNDAKFHVRSKKHKMAAEVACMDISGGCNTVHIRMQDKSTGQLQTAHLIARHTNAKVYFDDMKDPAISQNAEYERLYKIFRDTALISSNYFPYERSYVDKMTMTTSETIGGASNFTITMRFFLEDAYGRRGGDTLQLTGPLARPRRRDTMNVGVNMSPALTVVNDEVVSTDAYGTQQRFVDTISNTRLTRNDGEGNLALELTIRNATVESLPEKIRMRVARIHTPVQTLRIPMQ